MNNTNETKTKHFCFDVSRTILESGHIWVEASNQKEAEAKLRSLKPREVDKQTEWQEDDFVQSMANSELHFTFNGDVEESKN